MYCSNCGKFIPDNLNYCSGCGSPAEKAALVLTNSSAQRPFTIGATVIGGVGLVGLFPIIRTMLEMHVDPMLFCIVVIAYLFAVLFMFSVLIGHASKRSSGMRAKSKDSFEAGSYALPASFRHVNTSQLHAGEANVGSVTENTTRTLNEVLVERKS